MELLLRSIALLTLAFALWFELTRGGMPHATEVVAADSVGAVPVLAEWTSNPEVSAAHLTMFVPPDAITRDWIRGLRSAGVELGWDAPSPWAGMISVEPLPAALPRVRVAVASDTPVVLSDAAGVLDTLPAGGGALVGASVRDAVRAGSLEAPSASMAASRLRDSLLVRRVLVVGMAGWESKFVAAALEEAGWLVDARFGVAPTATVVQGSIRPDTARHAAVVVVDSSAASLAPAIARYARDGGGVVLLPGALALPALRTIAAGTAGAPLAPEEGMLASALPARGLALVPVESARPGVTVVERRDGRPAVAVRRAGAGRVAQVGYLDSWRWRLAGGDHSVREHREWWSALVGGVAYAPAVRVAHSNPWELLDDAPAARLAAILGAPEPAPAPATTMTGRGTASLHRWLFAAAAIALLVEWASRRSRGLP